MKWTFRRLQLDCILLVKGSAGPIVKIGGFCQSQMGRLNQLCPCRSFHKLALLNITFSANHQGSFTDS